MSTVMHRLELPNNRIRRWYEKEGLNCAEISARLRNEAEPCASPATIQRRLAEMGVEMRPPGARPGHAARAVLTPERAAAIRAEFNVPETQRPNVAEVAVREGVKRQAIYQLLHRDTYKYVRDRKSKSRSHR